MLLRLSLWALKSLLVLGVFHYGLPSVVDAATRNSWVKVPVMVALGLGAGAFMAWLGFIPFPTLFIIWLGLNARWLAIISKPKFGADAKMTIRRPVFAVSSYAYIVVACASAMFLQAELVGYDPSGASILLWRHLLGLSPGASVASVANRVMPAAMPLSLAVAFAVLAGLVTTHQRHAADFQGSSRDVQLVLTVSATAGSTVGFGLLVYYGVQTAWYWPVVLFIGGGVVFPAALGGHQYHFSEQYFKAVRAAKLVGVTIHCLRHGWASRLAESSGDLLLLQQLGGWSSLSMVQRYAHLREGRGAEAIRKMLADREGQSPLATPLRATGRPRSS